MICIFCTASLIKIRDSRPCGTWRKALFVAYSGYEGQYLEHTMEGKSSVYRKIRQNDPRIERRYPSAKSSVSIGTDCRRATQLAAWQYPPRSLSLSFSLSLSLSTSLSTSLSLSLSHSLSLSLDLALALALSLSLADSISLFIYHVSYTIYHISLFIYHMS